MISILAFFTLFGSILMVKPEDFKTCDQSAFCVRHRAFQELSSKSNTFHWSLSSINYHPTSIIGTLTRSDDDTPYYCEFNTLSNSIRVRIHEQNPIHDRFHPEFSIENIKDHPYQKFNKPNGDIWIEYEQTKLVLHSNPFKFEIFVNDVPAVEFNGRGLFYYEPYQNEHTVPNFAKLKEDIDLSESDKVIEELKKKVVHEVGSETFKQTTDSKPKGASSFGLDIGFPGSNHVFGIPSHASSFSLKTTRGHNAQYTEPYRLYNLDVFEYILDSPMALYGSIPFMMSHKLGLTTGVLVLNSAEMWIDIEKPENKKRTDTHWMIESGLLDLFIFTGPTQQDVFNSLTELTGRPQLPQQFAIAYHQCRWNYNTEDDVKEVDANFDNYDIPYDVLWLDIEHTDGKRYFTWDSVKFPTPEIMQNNLSAKGRKMVTIIDPHIKKDSGYGVSQKGKDLDIFVKKPDGETFDGWCWPGDSNWIDYTNPKGREYWSEQFRFSNYKGSTKSLYTWNDMNEPSVFTGPEITMPKDLIHHKGVEHRDVHNAYGMLQHRSTFEGHLLRNDNQDRPFILSRAFFAGTQRYGAIWTGDNTADWNHLASSVPMLLTIGISGVTFCGADVGGFFLNPDGELLTRWYQVGALQPFFRGHAHIDTKRREPWLFGEPYTTMIRDSILRRYKLLPYLYTLFSESNVNGSPVMRSLMQEFPKDELTFGMEDQFMLGSALLVKPVVESHQERTTVYLPPSANWYDYDTFEPIKSKNGYYTLDTPLEKLPIFLRGGIIVPRRDRQRRSSVAMKHDPYTLLVPLSTLSESKGKLYEDDGHSYSYKLGDFVNTTFEYKNNVLKSYPASSTPTPSIIQPIERIVIIGLTFEPSVIKYQSKELYFVTKMINGMYQVTIKNPGIDVHEPFMIQVVN